MTKTEQLERRVEQLERDVTTMARAVWPHVHPKSELREIVERHTAGGHETRPHSADEQRSKAVA